MSRFLSSKYKSLEPYTPGEQPKERKFIKLNTNESPFPPAPRAVELAAKAAKKLFEENLYYSNGEPVKVVIADTSIGRVPEATACADKFKKEGVDITLTVDYQRNHLQWLQNSFDVVLYPEIESRTQSVRFGLRDKVA